MRWNGVAWKVVPSPNAQDSENDLFAVAALSSDDVWAVGQYTGHTSKPYSINALIEHWDGRSWTVYNNPELGTLEGSLKSISVISANDIWAVGDANVKPLAMHWNGVKWSVVPVPDADEKLELNAVAAASSNDVWAVGESYTAGSAIVHWDGVAWRTVQSPAPQLNVAYEGAVALAHDNIWMIRHTWHSSEDYNQPQRQIIHWDGKQWSDVSLPASIAKAGITAITKDPAGNVWLAGSIGDGKDKPSYGFTARFSPTSCPQP